MHTAISHFQSKYQLFINPNRKELALEKLAHFYHRVSDAHVRRSRKETERESCASARWQARTCGSHNVRKGFVLISTHISSVAGEFNLFSSVTNWARRVLQARTPKKRKWNPERARVDKIAVAEITDRWRRIFFASISGDLERYPFKRKSSG